MPEDNFVYYNGKKLRKGFTTGTTATAASAAAARAILQQKSQTKITVLTANGKKATFKIQKCKFNLRVSTVAIKKDGGDDIDITDGMLIYATVILRKDSKITLTGGKGIGKVTKKGLPNPPGSDSINPVPRKVIPKGVRKVLGPDKGADIIIWAPEGEKIARKTANPKLGIRGGISILGTTGIVVPMSKAALKSSISLKMNVERQEGKNSLILTPGNYGEAFVKKVLKLSLDKQVQMSNFVGYALLESQRLKFKKVLLVGDLGKMIKVSAGIFSTHSKDADARAEIMVANLALMGAPANFLKKIYRCLTTVSMVELINKAGYEDVYQIIVEKIKQRAEKFLSGNKPSVNIEAVIFSQSIGFLAASKPLKIIKEEWQ